ncbi:MAG: branched-chain amino acid ABC transporter permease [Deltaproteobacteria bacterium]|nr:branched-chain amino acid ABC transporter permease [Deltaproteobacteria bacterium]
MWTTVLISGISLGAFYTLIALGFALIFGVTRVFNIAHGELLVLAGYLAYWLWKVGNIPLLFTFPVVMAALLLLCLVLARLFSLLRDPVELNSIVLSIGVAILLQNGMLFVFSGDYRLIRTAALSHTLHLAGIRLSCSQLTLLLLSVTVITILSLLMRHTYVGKALRATIQDQEAAALAGINVRSMGVLAFAVGGMLIGLAGPLYASIHYLYPAAGQQATLIAIAITIFSGVGRLRGIILGGWLLGLGESAAVILLGASWRELVSALLLLIFLMIRPAGLAGEKE